MGSLIRGFVKKKPDSFSTRIEVRVEPEFKKDFLKSCRALKENPSDAFRKALQQYFILGHFKTQLFEFLHNYPEARFHFEKFIKTDTSHKIAQWFDCLLGSEEKKLIENTPAVFLGGLQDIILTKTGRDALKARK
ncbi:MAG: hypothetical protein IMZ63_03025 [Actinobacteria bacterium]|nr:hypothetical protein [Actinomycetota bacterium]